jgi:hypothetical protein
VTEDIQQYRYAMKASHGDRLDVIIRLAIRSVTLGAKVNDLLDIIPKGA